MASGRTHAWASVWISLISATALLSTQAANFSTSIQVASGALAGVMVNPDLDLMETGNYSLAILRRYSPLLSKLYRLFWWPYAKISRHRGISHWPIIGTLLRAIYIFVPFFIIAIIINAVIIPVRINLEAFGPPLFGLMLSDLGHSILDVLT